MKQLFCIVLLIVLGCGTETMVAQTFSSAPNLPINDVATNDYPLTVSGLNPATIDTANFGLETVCINLTHTWDSDLLIEIIAPDGTTATLSGNNGGSDDDYTNTCFNYFGALNITQGTAPFTGVYIPQGQLGRVNNGQVGNGTWILRVVDQVGGDAGTMLDWDITFGTTPATYFDFQNSNLPIVTINTHGQNIVDDPKIMVDLGIIWNGPGMRNAITDFPNDYIGKAGIELRGSSSQGFLKKPYAVELWDANGLSTDSMILGMPAESDWALIPSFPDKSLMRNALTYRLGERIGHYAPRGQFAEVVINGEYVGVYYLCERIKRDSNRVNVSKLKSTNLAGDSLTGGYILKVDKLTGGVQNFWQSLYPPANNSGGAPVNIIVHYPNEANIQPQQLDYVHSYVDSFERALHGPNFQDTLVGYRHFAKLNSFVDYFLVMEFVKNLDAYRSSCYFYKDRESKGGKLKMGPLWDFDLSMGNGNFCDFWLPDGWAYEFNNVCPGDGWEVPFWWSRMLQDSVFSQRVRCRWDELKTTEFHLPNLFHWVDSVANYLDEGQGRNFTVWPILGTYVWPNYYIAQDYQGEVDTLKWYLTQRFAWLDANLPGIPGNCNLVGVSDGDASEAYLLYPNPSSTTVRVKAGFGQREGLVLRVYDMQGREVLHRTVSNEEGIDLSFLAKGVYAYRLEGEGEVRGTRRLVLE